jgi:hypothetical protein
MGGKLKNIMKLKNLIETRRKYYSYFLWIGSYLPTLQKRKNELNLFHICLSK